MEIYNTFAIIIVLAALFGYINFRFLKLPNTIGIMIISTVASLLVIGVGKYDPGIFRASMYQLSQLDFHTILMKVMLSFLLFAGAIHLDIHNLRKERLPIIVFSTIGVVISTIVVGVAFYFLFQVFGLHIELLYCLLFGSLISPTDPIAVIGILKEANISKSMETKISGESLFNDGVAVVVFISIFEIIEAGPGALNAVDIGILFIKEAGGGLLFGFGLGYLGFFLLRSINNYKVEVMITLAIVMGGYLLADMLHISGPLAMVVAGLITGNKSREHGMSDVTRDYVDKFWEMLDEVLNAILFLLIGFEMLLISFTPTFLYLGLAGIVIVLGARYISVFIPIIFLKFKNAFEKNAIRMLTWGGLRGGISVALALSLPRSYHNEIFISVTYIIVLFSIIVQGLTMGKVARKLR
ncbi:MAG: sodium:proton antiporter [Ferruginibacter sp.]